MRKHNRKWNIVGRRITILLLLCGLLLPVLQKTSAASITYEYTRIINPTMLPRDDQWHDFFIAWEDTDDEDRVWFTDYHWYTGEGNSNIDTGGSHWMQYKAASTLPDSNAASFTSKDCLGHMQIKYAGIDKDNDDSPKYYIRVSKMSGTYSYFTEYEPTNNEKSAEAFTFQDKGDVFHIFVNISGKADRYLTRTGQYLETTESSSAGGGNSYRPLRVYQRTVIIDETAEEEQKEIIGKVNLYEYHWINTLEEIDALQKKDVWTDIIIAWEDCDGGDKEDNDPDTVWYTKEVWYNSSGDPNYENDADNEFHYYSNDYLGSDGYGSAYAESFLLPSKAGHFQMKFVGLDQDNCMDGPEGWGGAGVLCPMFQFRFDIGTGRYIYVGNNGFEDDAGKAESFSLQMLLDEEEKGKWDYYFGSMYIFVNIGAGDQDEVITRVGNSFDISNWIPTKDWEMPFRIYTYTPVEYDAIVKSFSIGKGATYSIDRQLILAEGVTITVEDGGVLAVDDHLLNNGHIIVKNGGTVIVNEGGYIMSYDQKAGGKITLDGGNLIIMEGAKVIYDELGGTLRADNATMILNRGLLMVGGALDLRNSSYLKNEAGATLLVGGRISQERGGIGAFSFEEIESRVANNSFTFLCSTKSKLYNYGTISMPKGTLLDTSGTSGIVDRGEIKKR